MGIVVYTKEEKHEIIAILIVGILIMLNIIMYVLFTIRPNTIYQNTLIYDYINSRGGCEIFLSSKKYDPSKDEINKLIKLQFPILSIGLNVNDICKTNP